MSNATLAAKSAFETDNSLTTLLVAILRKQYGDEFFEWDPATVYLEIRDTFGAEPSSTAMDRISAAQVLMTTDAFFKRLDGFMNICNTLSSGTPAFTLFDPATTEEMAWAVVEVSLLRELMPFAYPVKKYCTTVLENDGYSGDYPDIFDHILTVKRPEASEVKEIVERELHDENKDNVDIFIDEQLTDLLHQFNEIPGLSGDLFKMLKEKDLEELNVSLYPEDD
jgi:hypothetical protein